MLSFIIAVKVWKNEPYNTVFRPVVEDGNRADAFLNQNPLLAQYQSLSKPWLLGLTTGEAARYVGGLCV